MDSLTTHITENGKRENRTVRLTPEVLEVNGAQGELLQTVSRREIAAAHVHETGGAAWLEVTLKSGATRRIAVCALNGIKELRSFCAKLEAWAFERAPKAVAQEPAPARSQPPHSAMSWPKRWKVLAGFMKYSSPYRKTIGLSGLVLLLTVGLGTVPPYLMKMIIDGGLLPSSESRFFVLIGLLFAVNMLEAAFQVWRTSIGIRIGNAMMSHIRKDMFDKLMKLSLRYYDQRKTAPFIGRIQYDTGNVQGFLSAAIPNMAAMAVMTAALVGLLFMLDWRMALLLIGTVPLGAVLLWRTWPKVRSLTVRTWNAEYALQQYIAETLQGVRVIKAFHQEATERHRFGEWNAAAVKRAADQQRWSQWVHPGLGLALSCGIALVWLVGGREVIHGHTSLGTVIAFTSYLTMFLGQLRWAYQSAGWANKAIASADRVLDLLNAPEMVPDATDAAPFPHVKGEISVRSVTFAYDKGREVLKDISFQIRPGEKVGITGRSGAGKTTLIHLLCRFYDPDSGGIAIDGTDLRHISNADLRRHIGIVFQETFLFDGTIAQNIAYGRPEASPEEIMEAALSANAHPFIAQLPFGYDTRIGERGVRLSGGEKQRISVARTLLQNPAILILDEATSSMDAETESGIQEALDRLCRGRTTLAIAHRLSTLRSSDRIIVLDQGRIAETGTHKELDERGGIYHQLLKANRLHPVKEEASV